MATTSQLAEVYLEVLGRSTPQVQIAHEYLEVLVQPVTPMARVGELYLEVLAVRPPDPVGFIGWGQPL